MKKHSTVRLRIESSDAALVRSELTAIAARLPRLRNALAFRRASRLDTSDELLSGIEAARSAQRVARLIGAALG